MKSFIVALFVLFLAVVNAASIPEDITSDVDSEAKADKVYFVVSTLPSGQRLLNLFEGNTYAGAIKEGLNEGDDITCYDPNGNVVDNCDILDDEENEDGSRLRARQLGAAWRLLRRFGRFIKRWGQRAWVSLLIPSIYFELYQSPFCSSIS